MRPAGDQRPLRAHLEAVEAQTGVTPDSLSAANEPYPPAVAYLDVWFNELNMCRRSGFQGPERIGYVDIHAWAALTHRDPTPQEVECVLMLDRLYIHTMTTKDADG